MSSAFIHRFSRHYTWFSVVYNFPAANIISFRASARRKNAFGTHTLSARTLTHLPHGTIRNHFPFGLFFLSSFFYIILDTRTIDILHFISSSAFSLCTLGDGSSEMPLCAYARVRLWRKSYRSEHIFFLIFFSLWILAEYKTHGLCVVRSLLFHPFIHSMPIVRHSRTFVSRSNLIFINNS